MNAAAVDHYRAGVGYQVARRWGEAIAEYDQAIALDHAFRAAVSRRATCLRREGIATGNASLIDEACAGLAEAIALPVARTAAFPGDGYRPERDLYGLAFTQDRLRRFDDSAKSYAAYLATCPDDIDARLNQGNMLWRAGRLSDAESAFRDALLRSPHCTEVRNNLAQLLVVLGRPQEAEAGVRAALNDPDAIWLDTAHKEGWRLLDTMATASLAMATATGEDDFIRDALTAVDAAIAAIVLPPTAVPGDPTANSYAVLHLRRGYCRAKLGTLSDARDSFAAAYRWSTAYSTVNLAAQRNLGRLAGVTLQAWTVPLGMAGVGIAVLAFLVLVFSTVELARGALDSAAFATVVISSLGAAVLGLLLPRISTFTVGGVQGTVAEVATKTSFELTQVSGPEG